MKNAILIFTFLFSFRVFSQGTWNQLSNYPGQAVMTGVGFSIGNLGYLGTGMDGAGNSYNEFFEYNPVTDTWTAKASLPGLYRHFAVGFSIGNKGYMGTGLANPPQYLNDFWEYDPSTDMWSQKANCPGTGRATAMAFSCLGKGYVGSGADGSSGTQDLWEFDPLANSWTQKANYPGGLRMDMERPFVIGTKMYCGNGLNGNYYNDFWEYDVVNDTWTQKANFGGTPRFGSTGFAICDYGYMGFGQDLNNSMNSDLWKYDPAANNWAQVTSLPSQVCDAPVFVIGDKAYLGPGEHAHEFWEYTPDSCGFHEGIVDLSKEKKFSIYPNPTTGLFTLDSKFAKSELAIYNQFNERIYSAKISSGKTDIDLGNFPDGIYFLKLTSGDQSEYLKILKQRR